MANNLSITASVLVVLFSISYARFTADLPGGVTLTDEPETVNSIFLPSEKPRPESKPATQVDPRPESESDVKVKLPVDGYQPDQKRDDPSLPDQEKKTAEDSGKTEPEPLTVITFRPINRHFPRNPLIPFRHGHKWRHMFRRGGGGPLLKRWGSRFNGLDNIPYGNDMILSSARRDDQVPRSIGGARESPMSWTNKVRTRRARLPTWRDDQVPRSIGGARESPMSWTNKVRTRRARLPTWRDDVGWRNDEEMMKAIKDKHHRIHRHVESEERKKEHEQQDQEQKVDNGFVKKIRKFLDHHF